MPLYTYTATDTFWASFNALSSSQKESVRAKWKVFKLNPFDPSLGTHKIQRLSSLHQRTVYSVVIEANLRVVFLIKGNDVLTLDVGTHAIYG